MSKKPTRKKRNVVARNQKVFILEEKQEDREWRFSNKCSYSFRTQSPMVYELVSN